MVRRVRSIVRSFEMLPFEEQREVLEHLHTAHERSRSAKRSELEQQLAELGYSTPKHPAGAKPQKKANGLAKAKRAARKNSKGTSVMVRYRDGKTGETWSGRGRMARWLKAKQDAGENIEKYLLN